MMPGVQNLPPGIGQGAVVIAVSREPLGVDGDAPAIARSLGEPCSSGAAAARGLTCTRTAGR
jgi:hypothetical protein